MYMKRLKTLRHEKGLSQQKLVEEVKECELNDDERQLINYYRKSSPAMREAITELMSAMFIDIEHARLCE